MLTELDPPTRKDSPQKSLDGDFQSMTLDSARRTEQTMDAIGSSNSLSRSMEGDNTKPSLHNSSLNLSAHPNLSMHQIHHRKQFQHKRQHSFDSMDSRLKAPLETMSDFGSIRDAEDMSMASSIKTEKTNLTKHSMDISIKSTDTEAEWKKTLSALKNSV
mmetsp:Transcript_27089/g.38380  ORF Transcript_27089/g.38380 Transcript_27089/m.38380 type:complete len:160 (-) Transcript_27089:142-621(-)